MDQRPADVKKVMNFQVIEISCLAMLLLATQDEIYSMELVSNEEQTLR